MRLKEKFHGRKGFTLAELLVVVAIIAILIAIAIPIFAASEEKAREAVDLSAIRDAYAEAKIYRLENGKQTSVVYFPGASSGSKYISLKQQEEDWQTTTASSTLNELFGGNSNISGKPKKDGTAQVKLEGDTFSLEFSS